MPSLKALRKRIASVRNTQQITKAMKMVSAAKLRRAQEAAVAARPYAAKLSELLANVAGAVPSEGHPLLRSPEEVRRIHLLLISADRGLCGAYNANLVRQAEAFIRENRDREVSLTIVGRKGVEHFRRRKVEIVDRIVQIPGPSVALAREIGAKLVARYTSGAADRIVLLYSAFRSVISQVPTFETLLPVSPPPASAERAETDRPRQNSPVSHEDMRSGASVDLPGSVTPGIGGEYLMEPGTAALLDLLLPQSVTARIHGALLEAAASEHGARMTAMDSATNNASEMILSLTLAMNRARQATITKELMEIVSGAEALRG